MKLKFTVTDPRTGMYPDVVRIARTEEWAKKLCPMEVSGFALDERQQLIMIDEVGNCAYPPYGRFKVTVFNEKKPSGKKNRLRQNDKDLPWKF